MMQNLSPIAESALLKDALSKNGAGIFTVKPKLVFKLVEDKFKRPVEMNLQIPSSDIGSLTMLEAAILTSLIRLTEPLRLFEFGTFLGYSTAIMATNSPDQAKVFSVDIDIPSSELGFAGKYSEAELRSNHISNDNYLRFVQSKVGPYYLRLLPEAVKEKINLIKSDSTKLNIGELGLSGNVQFIFVDGGHQFEIIKSDTEKALEMTAGNGIIVWHDYNSKIHSEVTDYLAEYSKSSVVLHVENSMIAFSAMGTAFSILFD